MVGKGGEEGKGRGGRDGGLAPWAQGDRRPWRVAPVKFLRSYLTTMVIQEH